ncbi:hypothetical protein ACFWUW_26200 [Streptomyces sp. NPDC058655]|uniref:hypothetical protein n=1 Tax=unclassified Streptomyces TaxID=2593676 RepID=UPI0036532056
MSARRPLLTALGATTLLGALWFVPSAGATAPAHGTGRSDAPAPANGAGARPSAATGTITQTAGEAVPLSLADTGSVDTTPYLLGGSACLGVGAGFVVFSVRRSRSA